MERRDFIAMLAATPAVTLCFSVVLHSSLAAQARPDFSGKWILDVPAIATTAAVPGTPAAAAAPGDAGSGWGTPLTITQDAKQLNVKYDVFSRYDLQPPLSFWYSLEGAVSKNYVMMGRGEQMESSKAQWNGSTLTIVTTFEIAERVPGAPKTVDVTRTLSLESPTTLVVDVIRAGVLGGPSSTTRSIYRKG